MIVSCEIKLIRISESKHLLFLYESDEHLFLWMFFILVNFIFFCLLLLKGFWRFWERGLGEMPTDKNRRFKLHGFKDVKCARLLPVTITGLKIMLSLGQDLVFCLSYKTWQYDQVRDWVWGATTKSLVYGWIKGHFTIGLEL